MFTGNEFSTPEDFINAGLHARFVNDRYDIAHRRFADALDLARRNSDSRSAASALLAMANNLVWVLPCELEETDRSLSVEKLYSNALELSRLTGDGVAIAASLRGLSRYDESLQISRRIGDHEGIIRSLQGIASVHALRGELKSSRSVLNEALSLSRDVGNPFVLANVLQTYGICLDDKPIARRACFFDAAELFQKLGYNRNRDRSLELCAFLDSRQKNNDKLAIVVTAIRAMGGGFSRVLRKFVRRAP